jgi:hypothetical protein
MTFDIEIVRCGDGFAVRNNHILGTNSDEVLNPDIAFIVFGKNERFLTALRVNAVLGVA